ncbi:hypothetical protein KIN20_024846 [Parelaphostrongylus tenuis]|uniref:Uncharacterized protein n=1 Tax=Parelaphostrongylus tenuis TaxID=148309 RepID=A0AAD5N8M0_PARTN|nr:hypothetical protein KIN20_024846 [Parelaphostrongylus tenuis]
METWIFSFFIVCVQQFAAISPVLFSCSYLVVCAITIADLKMKIRLGCQPLLNDD